MRLALRGDTNRVASLDWDKRRVRRFCMKSKWMSVGLLAALALPAYAQEKEQDGSKMLGKSCRKS